ncbi:MAG: 8-amino-7-oxononanoate synthase [Myxococcales bacterium]|nr:8-amino-7-oxononanoate synthase [Myxococcales bacterium]
MTTQWFEADLEEQRQLDRLRIPRTLHYRDTTHATLDGRALTVFCSNDYLGLRADPRLRLAADRAMQEDGVGSGASRLVSGDLPTFVSAEQEFASWLGVEASLLLTSGFAANVGVVPTLAGADDLLFSDALNHASLVDGCRLSKARTVVFEHASVRALERAIASARPFRRGWVLTESVFSMDGDVAPIAELRALCDREGLGLYVDEAHGIGVFDDSGRGVCAAVGVRADVLIGTAGKSLGCAGAFVAGARPLRSWLWNRCRSFVFSTGASVANAASVREGIRILRSEPQHVSALRSNTLRLREALRSRGIEVLGDPRSPIVPIVLGDERRAVRASEVLLEEGFFVSAIRPPTVPRGTSRLRVTVSAKHTGDEIDALAAALERVR